MELDYLYISASIQFDIDTGCYNSFTKLKDRLQYISKKLLKCYYVDNCELSKGEIKTLIENEYIEP